MGGVHSCQLPNQPDGSLALEDIENAIRPDDPHDPITRLICLENTHNRCGGTFQSTEYIKRVSKFAHARKLFVHLDGARIFNAAAAQHINARELAATVDSITFCLSKGLCAPVGSVLCGSKEYIRKALRLRKMVWGGMRQAGILAAAGIVALETMTGRLSEDHARARNLASGLRELPGLVLGQEIPATNMVFLSLDPLVKSKAEEVAYNLKEHGILVGVTGARSFRLVLHYWINDIGVDQTITAFRSVLH